MRKKHLLSKACPVKTIFFARRASLHPPAGPLASLTLSSSTASESDAADTRSQTAVSSPKDEVQMFSSSLKRETSFCKASLMCSSISTSVARRHAFFQLKKPTGSIWEILLPSEENLARRTRLEMSLSNMDTELYIN